MTPTVFSLISGYFLLILTGCVTPMTSGEIDGLTTCKGTNLQAIRKNLLLAGYEIQNQGSDDLTTGYKQVSGYSTSRELQRITVVKIADDQFRFRVGRRNESVQAVSTGSTVQKITTNSGTTPKNTYENTIDQRQLVATTNDSDNPYYVEYRANYEMTQHDVCGN